MGGIRMMMDLRLFKMTFHLTNIQGRKEIMDSKSFTDWIPVSVRLPESEKDKWYWCTCWSPSKGYFTQLAQWWVAVGEFIRPCHNGIVVAWLEDMPEPYRPEKKVKRMKASNFLIPMFKADQLNMEISEIFSKNKKVEKITMNMFTANIFTKEYLATIPKIRVIKLDESTGMICEYDKIPVILDETLKDWEIEIA